MAHSEGGVAGYPSFHRFTTLEHFSPITSLTLIDRVIIPRAMQKQERMKRGMSGNAEQKLRPLTEKKHEAFRIAFQILFHYDSSIQAFNVVPHLNCFNSSYTKCST